MHAISFQSVSQSSLALINNLNPLASRFSLNWRDSGAITGVISIVNRAVGALFEKSYIACGALVSLGALALYKGYHAYHSHASSLKEIASLQAQNQQLQNRLSAAQARIAKLEGQHELQKIKLGQDGAMSSSLSDSKKEALASEPARYHLLCQENEELKLTNEKLEEENQHQKQMLQYQKQMLQSVKKSRKESHELGEAQLQMLHSKAEKIELFQKEVQAAQSNSAQPDLFRVAMQSVLERHAEIK